MNESVSVKPAAETDQQWAAGQMAAADPWAFLGISFDQCLAACIHPANHVYIATQKGQPCGAIVLQDSGVAGSPYIKSLVVAPTHRGAGIGKQLVTFAEDLYRPRSRHLFLCVSSFNDRAIKFYFENGYEQVGEFKDYIVKGYDELLLHKWL